LIEYLLNELQSELIQTKFDCINNSTGEMIQIECELKRENVLDLDSSTELKFSRHLIIRLVDRYSSKLVVFENNLYLGAFVKQWIKKLKNRIEDIENIFFVKKDRSDVEYMSCVIDEGVYTKNRAFRMFLSCKYQPRLGLQSAQELNYKQIALLRLSNSNKYVLKSSEDQLVKTYFAHSLITNVGPLEDLLIVKFDNRIQSDMSHIHPTVEIIETVSVRKAVNRIVLSTEDIELLKQFILSIVPNGFIRKYKYHLEEETVTLFIGGNRYCENIGREHKSNHVFYVISFARGGGIYYQRCTDPECKDFSSIERKIPQEYLPVCIRRKL
jgi:hypothetical protein